MANYRSRYEKRVAKNLSTRGIKFNYESEKIVYTIPATQHTYTPDFVLANGILVETKGKLTLENRKKHILIQQQHPELDIRFLFPRPNNRIRKGSPTTYAMWAEKNGFVWAGGDEIPQSWIDEKS